MSVFVMCHPTLCGACRQEPRRLLHMLDSFGQAPVRARVMPLPLRAAAAAAAPAAAPPAAVVSASVANDAVSAAMALVPGLAGRARLSAKTPAAKADSKKPKKPVVASARKRNAAAEDDDDGDDDAHNAAAAADDDDRAASPEDGDDADDGNASAGGGRRRLKAAAGKQRAVDKENKQRAAERWHKKVSAERDDQYTPLKTPAPRARAVLASVSPSADNQSPADAPLAVAKNLAAAFDADAGDDNDDDAAVQRRRKPKKRIVDDDDGDAAPAADAEAPARDAADAKAADEKAAPVHAAAEAAPQGLSKKEIAIRYNGLVRVARGHEQAERLAEALAVYREAHALHAAGDVAKKIAALEKKTRKITDDLVKVDDPDAMLPGVVLPVGMAPGGPEAAAAAAADAKVAAAAAVAADGKPAHYYGFWRHTRSGDYYLLPAPAGRSDPSLAAAGLPARPSVAATDPYVLPARIYESIYPYQRQALQWFWKIHCEQMGGLLGDDMGLGKTIQTCSFLSGLFGSRLVKRVLILAPVSVLPHWEKECAKWCVNVRTRVYHGTSKKQRTEALDLITGKGGVLLASYGIVKPNLLALSTISGSTKKWDYLILDEGHKIKNPDIQLSKAVRAIPATHKILLSGTPVQNDLEELWALFDFACDGHLLGDRKLFRTEFAAKIVAGQDRNASARDKLVGQKISETLRALISPYFLRREKATVMSQRTAHNARVAAAAAAAEAGAGAVDAKAAPPLLAQQSSLDAHSAGDAAAVGAAAGGADVKAQPGAAAVVVGGGADQKKAEIQKNDLIVWMRLSDAQTALYRAFVSSDEVKVVLNSSKSPLAALTVLKKICDHPRLLSEEMKLLQSLALQLPQMQNPDAATLCRESGKLQLLQQLLASHKAGGHRTLVFSQSKKMLDLIEVVLRSERMTHLRIDGDVTDPKERQKRINAFNAEPEKYFCFLLTTQTGGLGIDLTGSDRVIIYDPAWNPSVDNQAVDRSYRMGQTRNVVVYRLISCGTIEEVIYRKQVFKGSLLRSATEKSGAVQHRYFSKAELREVFALADTQQSQTRVALQERHDAERNRRTYPALDAHLQWLHRPELNIAGVSDHDLLFSARDNDDAAHDADAKRDASAAAAAESEADGKGDAGEGEDADDDGEAAARGAHDRLLLSRADLNAQRSLRLIQEQSATRAKQQEIDDAQRRGEPIAAVAAANDPALAAVIALINAPKQPKVKRDAPANYFVVRGGDGGGRGFGGREDVREGGDVDHRHYDLDHDLAGGGAAGYDDDGVHGAAPDDRSADDKSAVVDNGPAPVAAPSPAPSPAKPAPVPIVIAGGGALPPNEPSETNSTATPPRAVIAPVNAGGAVAAGDDLGEVEGVTRGITPIRATPVRAAIEEVEGDALDLLAAAPGGVAFGAMLVAPRTPVPAGVNPVASPGAARVASPSAAAPAASVAASPAPQPQPQPQPPADAEAAPAVNDSADEAHLFPSFSLVPNPASPPAAAGANDAKSEPGTPPAPEQCRVHASIAVGDASVTPLQCRCRLSATGATEYNSAVAAVNALSPASGALQRVQLTAALRALAVCDDDPQLHLRTIALAQSLGLSLAN